MQNCITVSLSRKLSAPKWKKLDAEASWNRFRTGQ